MRKISASLLWPTSSRRQCFTTIGAASLWDRKFNLRHCECGTPTDSTGDSQKGAKVSALERHLWRSSRDVARKLRLSQPAVLGNRCDDEFYHFDELQSTDLFSETRLLWMVFCKRLRHEHAANKTFVHKILWVDEAHFRRDVLLNLKLSHMGTRWFSSYPRTWCIISFSVNLELVLSASSLCAPVCQLSRFLLKDIVIFWTLLVRLLEDISVAVMQTSCFLHDAPPADYEPDC